MARWKVWLCCALLIFQGCRTVREVARVSVDVARVSVAVVAAVLFIAAYSYARGHSCFRCGGDPCCCPPASCADCYHYPCTCH